MPGVLALRRRSPAAIERLYGAAYDPETEITVTAGATEALFAAITALVHPGDEVMLVEPCYDSYVPAVQLAGGVPVFVTLRHPDYAIDWDEVRRALTPRTRLVVLNSPHNPTGMVLGDGDLRTLAALLDGTRRPGRSATRCTSTSCSTAGGTRASRVCPRSRRARPSISSFGKSFHTTGWKIGYVAAPRARSRRKSSASTSS